MAEKITEEQVEALQKILASDRPIDEKVAQITAVKTSIKHHNVPDTCVAPLFEALRKASRSPHGVLVHAGLTSLNHLVTRLSRQEPRYISHERKETLKLLVDRMGDQKDKFRAIAVQSMVTMCKIDDVRPAVEGAVKEILEGKTVKAKAAEASLQWLLQAHQDVGLPFKTYVPLLMKLLENSDPGVRETARNTVIELFRDSSGPAKVDLKKKLVEHNVRPATQAAILKELNPRTATPGPDAEPPAPEPIHAPRPNLAASMSSISTMSVDRPFTPAPDTRTEHVEPSYINTSRELEDMFRDMHGYFEGNESEHNWKLREQSITRLRRLLAGNAPTDYADAFLSGLRGLLDGIIKAIKSLRTSLSKEGCSLVQDMAVIYGPGIDPMVELLMQTFIGLAGATKKIASQQANVCVDAIVGRVTYTKRIMEHLTAACADKNVQPRTYATGWLKTLLQKEAAHKSHIEHGGGLELLDKGIKRGLTDANPGVREKMRSTFWLFHSIWPQRANALMDTLEPTAQRLLEKDPNNPNAPKASGGATVRPGLGLSRSTMAPKPSIRDTIRAQKASLSRPGSAMETSRPARPGSAMDFSPPQPRASRALSNHSSSVGPSAAPSMAMRPKAGGLAGAPVRPRAGTRPNIPPRPKTAGPYDIRSSTEPLLGSPPQLKKAVTPRTMVGSPKRTLPRAVPGHKTANSGSSIPTPSRLGSPSPRSSPATSPHHSPLRTSRLQLGPPLLANSRHEDSMMVDMPNIADVANTPTPMIESPFFGGTPQPQAQESQDADMMDVDEPEAPSTVPEANGVQMETEPTQDQEMQNGAPSQSQELKVYEDPMTTEESPSYQVATTVLEERPVNEDAASLQPRENDNAPVNGEDATLSERDRQQLRLIDSALNKIKAKTLDVHGFRKFQGILRENKAPLQDEKFDALLLGLFDFLEDAQPNLAPEKVQDVKAQILATIKLLLKKHRDHFQPHVSKGLESLMAARAAYDSRTHIVSGLELLADELVLLGDAQEITIVLTKRMADLNARDAAGCRSLSMGLHVLKELVDMKADFMPTDDELGNLAALCTRCLESSESGVRMDAVQLCVALHARAGDARFWEVLKDVRDDPKSLITYYIVKRQRERGTAGA